MEKTKIILDVDTGHDDAVAILLAAKHQSLDLRGITVVAGNQILPKTLKNTINLCRYVGLDVPIYAGSSRPLVREQVVAGYIHGESGLGGVKLPESGSEPEELHAVDFIIEEALKYDQELVLIPLAPLTNIAMALVKEPKIKEGISRIVLMGGAVGQGNSTPSAEFNIFADPEAANIVFKSGIPITMVGLDLTHQAKVVPDVLARIRQIANKAGQFVVQSMEFYGQAYEQRAGFEGPPLHDVCAVAYVIDQKIMKVQEMWVDVELTGSLTYGRTVCDVNGVLGKVANAEVALELDQARLWELLISTLEKY